MNSAVSSAGYAHTPVISPTRELCRQIDEQTRVLTSGINLSTAHRVSTQALYGGTPKRRDLMQFERDFGRHCHCHARSAGGPFNDNRSLGESYYSLSLKTAGPSAG
jgi:hypothetical protein